MGMEWIGFKVAWGFDAEVDLTRKWGIKREVRLSRKATHKNTPSRKLASKINNPVPCSRMSSLASQESSWKTTSESMCVNLQLSNSRIYKDLLIAGKYASTNYDNCSTVLNPIHHCGYHDSKCYVFPKWFHSWYNLSTELQHTMRLLKGQKSIPPLFKAASITQAKRQKNIRHELHHAAITTPKNASDGYNPRKQLIYNAFPMVCISTAHWQHTKGSIHIRHISENRVHKYSQRIITFDYSQFTRVFTYRFMLQMYMED